MWILSCSIVVLTGYFNAYSDISKDVLIDVNLAPSVGFTSYKENLGEVKNSGVEVNLKGTVISNPENVFVGIYLLMRCIIRMSC